MAWYNKALSVATGVGAGLVTMNPMVGLAAYGAAEGLQGALEGEFDAAGNPVPAANPGLAAAAAPTYNPTYAPVNVPAPIVDPRVGQGNRIGGDAAAEPSQAQLILRQQSMEIAAKRRDLQARLALTPPGSLAYGALIQQIQGLEVQQESADKQLHTIALQDASDPARLANLGVMAQDRAGPELARTTIDPRAGDADYARYLEDRAQTMSLAGALGDTAYGRGGPSVAELQLQQGNQMAMNNALSIANSQRGGSGTLGTLEALRANATGTATTNQQQAILRAKEQMDARVALGNVLNAQASSDLAARTGTMGQVNKAADFVNGQNVTQFQGDLQARGQNDALTNVYTGAYMDSTGRPQQVSLANAGNIVSTNGQNVGANSSLQGQVIGANTSLANTATGANTSLATAGMNAAESAADRAERERLAREGRADKWLAAGAQGVSTYMAGNAALPSAGKVTAAPATASPYEEQTIRSPW